MGKSTELSFRTVPRLLGVKEAKDTRDCDREVEDMEAWELLPLRRLVH